MSEMQNSPVLVIGAGIAGLSVARNLQLLGRRVTILDPMPSPGGASFGNAGLISPGSVVPGALPGMLRHVPRWLLDPLGPLSIKPGYFPRALPWLTRWLSQSVSGRVSANSNHLASLHGATLSEWRRILGGERFDRFIRRSGQLFLWSGETPSRTDRIVEALYERHGVERQPLDRAAIERLLPGVSAEARRGMLLPGNAYTVSPSRLIAALAEAVHEAGGAFHYRTVMKLIPGESGGWRIMTNTDNFHATELVLAAGAWSGSLLSPLGIRVPLETERGYHAMLKGAALDLAMPVLHKSLAVGLTPMSEGLCVAGTIEFAGLDTAPNEKRAIMLQHQARLLFPDIGGGDVDWWMGHRPSTPDSLPVLGPVAGYRGLHLCLGHGQTGMTGGPPSGRLVAELIDGRHPFLDPAPYSCDRFR